jgi:hypothetical protein
MYKVIRNKLGRNIEAYIDYIITPQNI